MKVFRAEHLPPLDETDILNPQNTDAYVKAAFAGSSTTTKTVEDNLNPEFN